MNCTRCETHPSRDNHVLCDNCLSIAQHAVYQCSYHVTEDNTVCLACKRSLYKGEEFYIRNGKCFCNVHCASRYAWKEVGIV